MDWTPLNNALIGLAAATITAAAGTLTPFLVSLLRERLEANKVGRVVAAAGRAAGTVADFLAQNPATGAALEQVKAAAWQAGLAYMAGGTTGKLVAQLGYSPDRVAEMVRAEVGKLRVQDPSVPVFAPVVGDTLPPLPGWSTDQVARLLGAAGGKPAGQGV